MSPTIVLNTLTGAVSEYSNFGFDSITPTHAASDQGLFELNGDRDGSAKIVAKVQTGKKQWGVSLKKYVDVVFFGLLGDGQGQLTVVGDQYSYQYNFDINQDGDSRAKPGRGIRENFLAFGFSNPDGQDFQLDRIECSIGQSNTRRTR